MAVQNGRLDVALLVAVAPGLRLTADAAASWLRLAADVYARYGWTPTLTDAYRPYAEQVRIFNERYDPATTGSGPFGDVRWWAGVRYVRMRGASAAVPGTSNHGLGSTVDVTGLGAFTSERYQQFATVAVAHGWDNSEGSSVHEPWHWVRIFDLNPAPAQEDDMLDDTDKAAILDITQRTADSAMRGLIPLFVEAVWSRRVLRVPDHPSTALQDMVDGTTAALAAVRLLDPDGNGVVDSPTVDVDEAALAVALAPLLTAHAGQVVAGLAPEALAQVARAVADEQARRLAT